MELLRFSNCCGALPIGELAEGDGLFTGRCSKCKDGASFFTAIEYRSFSTFDEGMVQGGDKYNDTMFGAGDELEHERMDD